MWPNVGLMLGVMLGLLGVEKGGGGMPSALSNYDLAAVCCNHAATDEICRAWRVKARLGGWEGGGGGQWGGGGTAFLKVPPPFFKDVCP